MAPGKKALGGKNAPSFPPSALPEVASTPCLPPTSKTLVAGKKSLGGKTSSHTPSAPEEEDMDLSSVRARNIMRNNQFALQLGVRKLAELFKSSHANKKTAGKSIGKKSKGKMWAAVCHHLVIISRTSKRVLAPENSEETMRCTRQRAARQQLSTTSLIESTEVGFEPDLSANQNQSETNITEQDNLTISTEVHAAMGLNNTGQGWSCWHFAVSGTSCLCFWNFWVQELGMALLGCLLLVGWSCWHRLLVFLEFLGAGTWHGFA